MTTLSQHSQDLLMFYAAQADYTPTLGYMQQYQDLLSRFAKSKPEVLRNAVNDALASGIIAEGKIPGSYGLTQDGIDWIIQNIT